MPEIKCERDKYLWIYNGGSRSYGKRNHGSETYQLILDIKPKTLLDVGCGKGIFVEWAKSQGIDATGMDFASGYGVKGDILDMPFDDNSFDMVTAFDALEHLRPETLETGLNEMARVSKKWWVLSIGYGPSKIKTPDGKMSLHPIATRRQEWWTPIFSKYGEITYRGLTRGGRNPYIFCDLTRKGKLLLIGNGPSVLKHEAGKAIDNYDGVVARFNQYRIKGYEKYVGKRTDYWITNRVNKRHFKDYQRVFISSIRDRNEENPIYIALREKYLKPEYFPEWAYEETIKAIGTIHHSSGAVAATSFSRDFEVYLHGFDSFQGVNHYGDSIPACPSHKPEKESAYFTKLIVEEKAKLWTLSSTDKRKSQTIWI